MVRFEELVAHLKRVQKLEHPLLGRIVKVLEKTVLVTQGDEVQK